MPRDVKKQLRPLAPLDDEVHEVIADALDTRYKSKETAEEDIKEAFHKIPRENIESVALVLRDMANEAAKAERWDEAVEHYTSVLAAHPADHEVLANRSLAYLRLQKGPEALQDAALCVNLKPDWAKGFYRLGCALELCKEWKDSAAVFAKVVEMEPGNVEAAGRLIKAREMLQMVMNVERVQDPLWMQKPEPEKTALQKKTEEAAALNDSAMNALREELGKCSFDPELCSRRLSPDDKWFADSLMAKGLAAHLSAHSAVLAPRQQLEALLDRERSDAYADIIRTAVPQLIPRGQAGVVLHFGSAMGLLPLLSMEAGANKVYVVEPHGFLAKLAHAHVQRHTLITFEQENWARLPMNVGLAERTKQAAGICFKNGQYERAIAMYTEALPATDRTPELKANLLCNRALCYLKLGEPESALADAKAASSALPEFSKAHYRAAQAFEALGRIREARFKLTEVIKHSKHHKNADAEKMLAELEGRQDAPKATVPVGQGAGARAARRALIREDRAQRMTVQEVNDALTSRCEHFSILHKPWDKIRMHHELHQKPDLVVCHNIDYALLGQNLIGAINNLKKEECLRPNAIILPAAARVWVMAVEVLTDTGLPVHMDAISSSFWSPIARPIDMDDHFYRRTIKPLSKPALALAFDFRATAPQIKWEEKFEMELSIIADGSCNAVVFWHECQMGPHGTLSSAPRAAAAAGATRTSLGQALQFLPKAAVEHDDGDGRLRLVASHNRSRIRFTHAGKGPEPPRRGLIVQYQYLASQDGHHNRTLAAAMRKAIFSQPKNRNLLILHVGAGFGTQSIVAASARPECADHVVACEKSADLLAVAVAAARDNHVSERISFLQKDARNLKAHEDMKTKADLLILECIDHTLIGEGVLHYVQHLRGSYLKDDCRLIPVAGVMKGMLVELRTGELHGVDMTMCDAYRWQKEVRPIDMRKEDYTQLTEVFDIFVFDFAEDSPSQQVENMEIVISKDGIVSALVIWFDLILDEEIVVSTSPFGAPERTLGLGQGIVYLQPCEAKVKRGSTLPLVAATNGVELAFTIDEDKMTRKSEVELLPHTRFDPRWEGARANLDDQWKKILQNLSYNPKELVHLQEAVMRLAAQPNAFGIDASVAERCALTFLSE